MGGGIPIRRSSVEIISSFNKLNRLIRLCQTYVFAFSVSTSVEQESNEICSIFSRLFFPLAELPEINWK